MKHRRKGRREAEEVNLLPVMNLMVTLIPFLLLGAAFYKLGNIPVSVTTEGNPSTAEAPPSEIKVTMSCTVHPDRIVIGGSAAELDEPAMRALDGLFANKGGKSDLAGVTDHLAAVKKKYPKSDTVMLFPHDALKYQDLIRVLDATREKKLKGKGPDGEQRVAVLFPVTVFSENKPADPVPADGAEAAP